MHLKRIFIFSTLVSLSISMLSGQGLTIGSGSHMVVRGSAAVVIQDGNLIIDGVHSAGLGTTVYMRGTVADTLAKIGGSNPSFNQLVIDKSSNGVQLESDLTFFPSTSLQMLSGDLDLNGKNITLFAGANILDESESSRIKGDSGSVITSNNLNAPNNLNPANIGLTMTSADNLGTFVIRRIHETQTINGQPSAQRHYKIEYFNTGLSIDYTMKYFNAELNGINEAYLQAWKYNTSWKQRNADALDTISNTVQINTVSELDTLWALSTGQLQLTPKVLLSGPYDTGGLMKDDLRTAGVIPMTEPYTALGYTMVNCPCDSTTQAVLDVTGNGAIIDWVLVELRLKSNRDSILQSVTGLLQKDGDIVDVDGLSPLKIPNFPADSFYVAVKHRNHIGVITPAFQELTPLAAIYDFTTDIANTEGGLNGIDDLGSGYYGMYSGDVDRNGQIQNTDASLLILKLGSSGYQSEDLDLNNQIQNTDLNIHLVPNTGRGVQFNN